MVSMVELFPQQNMSKIWKLRFNVITFYCTFYSYYQKGSIMMRKMYKGGEGIFLLIVTGVAFSF